MLGRVMGTVYLAIQLGIMFGLIVPLGLVARLLQELHPNRVARRLSQGPYYWACQAKRRARGEDEWQRHDWEKLGILPPKGHPIYEQMVAPVQAPLPPGTILETPPRRCHVGVCQACGGTVDAPTSPTDATPPEAP